METQYCPRPQRPPSPPPTPPPDPSSAHPSEFLLNDESDALWLSALDIARSVQDPLGAKVEPYHLFLALLYKGITNIDDVILRKPPVLDVPLLWKIILEAGGNPEALGIDIRQRWLSEIHLRSQTLEEPQQTSDPESLLNGCSSKTQTVLLNAKAGLAKTGDSFVAPHHIILALLQDSSIQRVLNECRVLYGYALDVPRLVALTKRYRPHKVTTRETRPRFFVIEQYASDLTEEAGNRTIGPVIGRDEEIRRLTVILSRRHKCNAVLLGEPGVGKTAVAEALALRIWSREVPDELNCRIFSLDMGSLLASTTCHGKLELRVKAILEEIQQNEAEGVPIILYIDSLHLITTGRKTGGAGGMDVANLMKPLFARGKIRCFGSATFQDYKDSIEKDASLDRRFARILICEPTSAQTLTMLRGLKKRMEDYHKLTITDAALQEAADLAARYAPYRRLPDSAIDLVDEACSMLKVNQVLRPEALEKLLSRRRILEFEIRCLNSELEQNDVDSKKRRMRSQASLERVRGEITAFEDVISLEQAKKNHIMKLQDKLTTESKRLERLERQTRAQAVLDAKVLRGELRKLREQLDGAKKTLCDHPLYPNRVTAAVIAQVISEQTSIPVQSVMAHEKPHYISLEEDLNKAVFGQKAATRAISQAIHLSRNGFSNPCRPVASMLLVGEPGTGKTFIAKELVRLLFESQDKLLVINGAEYASKLSIVRLIGTPSCSGYDHGGELTECIKRKPFCIVLVDNIDKSCPEFRNKFRMLIDQGWLADGDGKVIDFRNCIILMTTAVESQLLKRDIALFQRSPTALNKLLSQHFSPDFLNCLDAVIPFPPLSKHDLEEVLETRYKQVQSLVQERGFTLQMERRVKELLVSESDSRLPNARTLLRRFRHEVEDSLGLLLTNSPPSCHFRITETDGFIQVYRD